MAEIELTAPYLIVNFKNHVWGPRAVALAELMQEVAAESNVTVIAAVSPLDVMRVAQATAIPVFSQHVDPIERESSTTGFLLPEAIQEAGAVGTLINHSENRMKLADIARTVERCHEAGLLTCLCTDTAATTRAGAALNPTMVAVEPPDLIGTGKSVSTERPEIVLDSVEAANGVSTTVNVLCGAGVTDGKDVKAAIALGTVGVLLAGGVTKAKEKGKDLRTVLRDLLSGYGNANLFT
jgi:triosephosphate isomerase